MFGRSTKVLIAVCALFSSSTEVNADQTPGFGISVSQDGLNQAKNIITPYIFANLKDLVIPELDFDGGYLKNIDIKVPEPALTDVNINLDQASNGVELICNNVVANMVSDFKYTYGILSVTGKATINIKKINMDIELDVGTQSGSIAGELAPLLKVQKMNINMNPDDIDITLSGSLVAKIASVFIPLFKSTLIPMIVNDLVQTVTTTINTTVD